MKIRVREVVSYGGHSVSAKGIVTLTLKAGYSELVNTIQASAMLNNDVRIKARLPMQKPFLLGEFRIKQFTIDGDGQSTLKLSGITDYIELDALNELSASDEDVNEFVILMESEIEQESGEQDEEN